MLYLVTGGSGSGKSEYAENLVLSLGRHKRIYIATMMPFDGEAQMRVERHRRLRAEKGFQTIEQYRNLSEAAARTEGCAVLLECMSNLAANELFADPPCSPAEAEEKIMDGLSALLGSADTVVVVTNEIFSDGMLYDESMKQYLALLGRLNRRMAELAHRVTEVVYGIPLEVSNQ